MINLDEAIKYYEKKAEDLYKAIPCDGCAFQECKDEKKQLAEWLRELQRWREFGDWVVKAVLDDDWEDNADFYAEVLCRKLTKLGKLKLKDHKYMAVNADEPRFPYIEGELAEMFVDDKWIRGRIVNGYRFRDGVITIETDDGKRYWCGQDRTELYRPFKEVNADGDSN